MHTVWQGETGGSLAFPYSTTSVPAVSGYIFAVARDRRMFRFDGSVASGNLYVARSGIANCLEPGDYVALPQLVDANARIYFLDEEDIRVVDVPDFFLMPC